MNGIYFEDIHRASEGYPYLDFEMKNINYIAHFHEEIEIIYVVEGTVSVVIDNEDRLLAPKELCFIMPGEIHSLSSPEPCRLYILKILPRTYPDNYSFLSIRLQDAVVPPDSETYPLFLNAILKIRQEDAAREEGYEYAVGAAVSEIIVTLLRRLAHSGIEGAQKKKMTKRLLLLKGVNEFIKDHYAEQISLDEISNECGYSKFYFSHYFKEVTGMSFLDYLTLYRLDRAVALMQLPSESITNIALSCGFNNLRSFNRSFKKHFQMSPTAYLHQRSGRD